MILIDVFSRYDFKSKLPYTHNHFVIVLLSTWLTPHKAITKSSEIGFMSELTFEVITTNEPTFLAGGS